MGVLFQCESSSSPSPTFSSDESNNTEQTEQNDYVNPAKHGILQYIPKCFDTLLDVWYAWKITNTGIIGCGHQRSPTRKSNKIIVFEWLFTLLYGLALKVRTHIPNF